MSAVVVPIQEIFLVRGKLARIGLAGIVCLIIFISVSAFSPKIFATEQGDLVYQLAAEALWVAFLIASVGQKRRFDIQLNKYTITLLAFIAYAVLSSLWSSGGAGAFLKAAALALNVFGMYILIGKFSIEEIIDIVILTVFLLISISLLIVFFYPDIGILDDWQHNGQWNGLFDTKQALGINASILLFCATMRMRARDGWLWRTYHVLVIVSAITCVIGSGSRGGGVLAGGAIVLSLLSSRSRLVQVMAAWIPAFAFGLAVAAMLQLYVTNLDVLSIGDFEIDLTDRTKIWKHAIDNVTRGSFLFGYGLNGFWTDRDVEASFLGQHGWFLDNYHSGYVYICAECGLIGAALFFMITVRIPGRFKALRENVANNPLSVDMAAGFIILIYIINLSETFFLRSTNFYSILSLGLLFYGFGSRAIER